MRIKYQEPPFNVRVILNETYGNDLRWCHFTVHEDPKTEFCWIYRDSAFVSGVKNRSRARLYVNNAAKEYLRIHHNCSGLKEHLVHPERHLLSEGVQPWN